MSVRVTCGLPVLIFRAQLTTLCSSPAQSPPSSGFLVQGALSPLPGLGAAELRFAAPNAQAKGFTVFGLSPVNVGRGTAQLWCGHRLLCPSRSPLCLLFSRHSWDPAALAVCGGVSSALCACSPHTRRCWKVWAMSSHSSCKPRKRPRRSSRESEPLNPAQDGSWGPPVVFGCFPTPVTLIAQGRILP